MPVARQIEDYMSRSSWIRAMFEAGAVLKEKYGADKVFDFSLGNPNLEPPEEFYQAMERLAVDRTPGVHGYMPNSGYPVVRAQMAEHLSDEQGVPLSANDLVMTVGAGGGLNITLKTICDPGAEIIVPAPYFVEYDFYAENHGARIVAVDSKEDFSLDIPAMAAALGEHTAAVLINTPNNPTGAVYSREELQELARLLEEHRAKTGKVVYLISDEPYRQIVFDGKTLPKLFTMYRNSILVNSYSKSLSLPGERIGYAAVHPEAEDKALVVGGMTLCNRILGFVNAPALMQRAVAHLLGTNADMAQYEKKRDLICAVLDEAGFEYHRPGGTFYVFPKSPIPDDVAFVKAAQEELILLVPGSGFKRKGHFRIAFCCSDQTIINSRDAFLRLAKRFA